MVKFYAVRKGRKPGIYSTWDECSAQVKGYKGGEFKKFSSLEEAQAFMAGSKNLSEKKLDALDPDQALAYIDGSYHSKTKDYGAGIVFFTDQGKETYSIKGSHPEYHTYRNVAGEVLGALFAMEKAMDLKKKKLYLYYDYAGIEYWAKGEWKQNNELTKSYHKKAQKFLKSMEIHFVKVAAHSGVTLNDEADELAKKSIGLA